MMQVRTSRAGANTGVHGTDTLTAAKALNNRAEDRQSPNEPTVYTVCEVARILRLGKISVYQAIEKGEIPCIRIGRRILIPRHALERLLENLRLIPKPAA